MKNILFFAIYVMLNPRFIRLFFKGIYLPAYIQFEWLKNFNIKCVVDVGANDGYVCQSIAHSFKEAMFYAFEPIQEKSELIKRKMKDKFIVVETSAVSDRCGKAKFFYFKEHDPASSLLRPSKISQKEFSFMNDYSEIEVNTITLDEYFGGIACENVFLKIDVQGTEKKVLEGGKNFLEKVDIVYIENSFHKMYEETSFFEDIYGFLVTCGFVYAGSMEDANFYPRFELSKCENSIFIKKPLWVKYSSLD